MGQIAETMAGARCRLRPIGECDIDAIAHHLGDWDVVRMLSMPPWPYTRDHAAEFVAKAVRAPQGDLPLNRAIAELENDDLMGVIGASRRRGFITFGYWLGKAFSGQGIATEAGRLFVRALFEACDDQVIKSYVYSDNTASLRVQEKLGFRVVGWGDMPSGPRGGPTPAIHTIVDRERFAAIN